VITHVVLFKLDAGVAAQGPAAQAFHAAMLALPGQIPQIRSWQCGFNITPDAQAYDYVLVAGFDDLPALHAYFGHPAHVAAVERLAGLGDLVFGDISV
jgi:hypothetical protein